MINSFYIGDTKTFNFTITKASDNTAIDISNWEIYITFKVDKADLDGLAVLQKVYTVPPSANATAGLASMVLTSDDTNKFPAAASYYYDIQRVIPGAIPDVATLEEGKVKVLMGVTRVDVPHAYVPDITDTISASGQIVITNAGFAVGAITTESSTTINTGNVIRTSPLGNKYKPLGSSVAIVVAS